MPLVGAQMSEVDRQKCAHTCTRGRERLVLAVNHHIACRGKSRSEEGGGRPQPWEQGQVA